MRQKLNNEDGFTLVELLVTMTISLIVLGAILLTAQIVATTSEANNRLTDAQDDARIASSAVARDVRLGGSFDSTSPVATAQTTDFVIRRPTPVVTGYTGATWTRYCTVASGSSWVLRRVAVDGAAPPTGACPALSATAPTGARYDTPVRSTLTTPNVFTYTCAAAPCASTALVRTVGITLSITRKRSTTPYVSTSAVTLRNHAD